MSREEQRALERERVAKYRRNRGSRNRAEYVAEMTERVRDALNAYPGLSCERLGRLLDVSYGTVYKYKRLIEKMLNQESECSA